MHKSWSMSYSYNNDGSKISEVIHKSHNDGNSIYKDGYFREKDQELKEKFYKTKEDKTNQKILLGKSKNEKDWELLLDNNINKNKSKKKYKDLSKKFLESPSTLHRLDKELLTPNLLLKNSNNNKNNNKKIIKSFNKNNNLISFNEQNQLNKMFDQLSINKFDDDDFFLNFKFK